MVLRFLISWTAAILTCSAANYTVLGNIRYSPHSDTVLDLLQPRIPALKDRPGVLIIHGGGWVSGSKEDMLAFCLPFLDRDFVVANLDYRLAGSAPAPAAVEDVLRAARWFRDNANEYHVDPKRIIALGASAGGHLALLTGLLPSPNDFGPVTKIAAVIDFFGVSDVAQQVAGPGRRDYAELWLPAQTGRLELAQKLSPLSYARKDAPLVLAIHGDADDVVPYDQSVRLLKALKDAGSTKSELITVAGAKHGFSQAQMADLWPRIFAWLKKNKLS